MKMCRGFTLLELMVTIAVLAILLTIAVPSFRDLVESNRVTAQTNELVSALAFARTEAVKRGRQIDLVITEMLPNGGWSIAVRVSGASDNLRVVERPVSPVEMSLTTVTFRPTGAATSTSNVQIAPRGGSTKHIRCVSVAPSGHVATARASC